MQEYWQRPYIGAFEENIGDKVIAYKKNLEAEVLKKVENLKQDGWINSFDEGQ